jgi:hypothetical protein
MDFPAGVSLSLSKLRVQKSSTSGLKVTNNPDQLDSQFYVKAYKDVKPKFTNPFTHYYTVGKNEERLPNEKYFHELYPLFDLGMYAIMNPDLSKFTPEELMSHFHGRGKFECRIYR